MLPICLLVVCSSHAYAESLNVVLQKWFACHDVNFAQLTKMSPFVGENEQLIEFVIYMLLVASRDSIAPTSSQYYASVRKLATSSRWQLKRSLQTHFHKLCFYCKHSNQSISWKYLYSLTFVRHFVKAKIQVHTWDTGLPRFVFAINIFHPINLANT